MRQQTTSEWEESGGRTGSLQNTDGRTKPTIRVTFSFQRSRRLAPQDGNSHVHQASSSLMTLPPSTISIGRSPGAINSLSATIPMQW